MMAEKKKKKKQEKERRKERSKEKEKEQNEWGEEEEESEKEREAERSGTKAVQLIQASDEELTQRHRRLGQSLFETLDAQDEAPKKKKKEVLNLVVLVKSGDFLPPQLRQSEYQEVPNFYYLSGLWCPGLAFGLVYRRQASKTHKTASKVSKPGSGKDKDSKDRSETKIQTLLFVPPSFPSSESPEALEEFGLEQNWPAWAFAANVTRLRALRDNMVRWSVPTFLAQLGKGEGAASTVVFRAFSFLSPEAQQDREEKRRTGGKTLTLTKDPKTKNKDTNFLQMDMDTYELDGFVREMRMAKSEFEAKCISIATQISCDFHEAVRIELAQRFKAQSEGQKPSVRKVETDLDLEGMATAMFRSQKATHAYFPIVLTNLPAARHLHGRATGETLSSARSVLLDVGAKLAYCSDITRTWLLSPTSEEVKIHATLIQGLEHLEENFRPGMYIGERHRNSIGRLYEDWVRLKHPTHTKQMLVHSIGHHVGLQVHDFEMRPLKDGDFFALEVGYYDSEKGIGMRLEDMYTIKNSKLHRLSKNLARTL